MTENEAIEILEEVKELDDTMYAYNRAYMNALDMAIEVLKEVQQYREIGTVEQVRNQKHNLEMAYKIISDYEAIGTVEECREAVEKQKAKKPVLRNDNGKLRKSCPVCGCFFSLLSRSCPKFGQAIDNENWRK